MQDARLSLYIWHCKIGHTFGKWPKFGNRATHPQQPDQKYYCTIKKLKEILTPPFSENLDISIPLYKGGGGVILCKRYTIDENQTKLIRKSIWASFWGIMGALSLYGPFMMLIYPSFGPYDSWTYDLLGKIQKTLFSKFWGPKRAKKSKFQKFLHNVFKYSPKDASCQFSLF